MPLMPSLGRQRHLDLGEFKATSQENVVRPWEDVMEIGREESPSTVC